MPILKSAKKALRASLRKTKINLNVKKKLTRALADFKKKPSAKFLAAAYTAIDKAAKKRIISKNRYGRLKSKLALLIKPQKTSRRE